MSTFAHVFNVVVAGGLGLFCGVLVLALFSIAFIAVVAMSSNALGKLGHRLQGAGHESEYSRQRRRELDEAEEKERLAETVRKVREPKKAHWSDPAAIAPETEAIVVYARALKTGDVVTDVSDDLFEAGDTVRSVVLRGDGKASVLVHTLYSGIASRDAYMGKLVTVRRKKETLT